LNNLKNCTFQQELIFYSLNICILFLWQTIPSKFGKTHFDLKKKRGDIYFQLLNGRVWPAKYTIRRCSTGLKFELTSGWKKFAKDNNLKVGDACNFELILSTNMTFQVEIFREKENGNTNRSTSQRKCYFQNIKFLYFLLG
jgi:hypothetical protein